VEIKSSLKKSYYKEYKNSVANNGRGYAWAREEYPPLSLEPGATHNSSYAARHDLAQTRASRLGKNIKMFFPCARRAGFA